jgi:rhomboid family GlyGly-CTERM serine protease
VLNPKEVAMTNKPLSFWFIAFTVIAAPLLYVLPTDTLLEWNRHAIAQGQLWRLFTSHFVHWSPDHLFWSAGAFALLTVACLRIAPRRFVACTLIASLAISSSLFLTNLTFARGLSGIDSALFSLIGYSVLRDAISSRQRARAAATVALLLAFAAKISYEFIAGRAIFVTGDASGMVVVPLAHAVGGVCGLMIGAIGHFWLPIRAHLWKMHASGGVCRRGFWSSKTKRNSPNSSPRSSACAG